MNFLIRFMADYAVIIVVLIGAWAILFKVPKGHRFEAYSRILMAGLTAYLIAQLVATIYQPEALRPFQLAGVQAGAAFLPNPGFPSDHALFVTAITLAVWFETRMKKLSIFLAIMVVVICVGRVVAQVHTPLDVTAGVIIALIGALWYSNKPRIVGAKGENHGHGKGHSGRTSSSRKTVVGTS